MIRPSWIRNQFLEYLLRKKVARVLRWSTSQHMSASTSANFWNFHAKIDFPAKTCYNEFFRLYNVIFELSGQKYTAPHIFVVKYWIIPKLLGKIQIIIDNNGTMQVKTGFSGFITGFSFFHYDFFRYLVKSTQLWSIITFF